VNSAGFNTSHISSLPLEVCMTINDHWFHVDGSINYKSTQALIGYLVRSASVGANYLLNVGPLATGEIVPTHVSRLHAMGRWLRTHGESVYGTRAGVIPPTQTVSTRRGDTHYLHILADVSDCVTVKGVPETIQSAHLLATRQAVDLERQAGG